MGKQERQENAKSKPGVNVQLWERKMMIEVPGNWRDMGVTAMGEHLKMAEAVPAYVPAASENEGIRNIEDARDWMNEHNFVGTVMIVCRRPWGKERCGMLTRAEQKVFTIS